MIVVNGIVRTTQTDIDALQQAIAAMEEASRKETGCVDYTFSIELNNPDILRITEKWDNENALKAHMASPHMAAFQKTMSAHPPISMNVCFYRAEDIQPFS
ncbi:MAG: antibiotic biosynthesis monooxygenase [Halioglobus sp.]|nr:antibiotic biosynthesis monooxygenase [Halioglobus sp.]